MLKKQDHRVRVAASRREEMQNTLLFSALVLASNKSIHEIDVEDIIEHAEVSRGSFYKYFPSVQALVTGLAGQLARELAAEIDAMTQDIPDTACRLVTTARLTMRLLVKVPLLGNFLIQLPWPSPSPELNIFKNINRAVELGIKEGLFTKMPVSIGCNLLTGSMLGGIHSMLAKPPSTGYENKVLYQTLIGLGLASQVADDLLKTPMPSLPSLPATGVLGKIATMTTQANR